MIHTVDGAGLLCVQVLLKLRRAMTDARAGSIFHVVTDDPAAPLDLNAWCHMTGHTYLGPLSPADAPSHVPIYALRLELGAGATEPEHPWRLEQQ